jgi:hypothetical protein
MVFLNFDPLTATGMAFVCRSWAKSLTKWNQVYLSLRLRGIKFPLVSDEAESSFCTMIQ